jgi:hypothetical protein
MAHDQRHRLPDADGAEFLNSGLEHLLGKMKAKKGPCISREFPLQSLDKSLALVGALC